ncbi:hypothetical protein D9611_009429 [Ephemerocybe angulata]|uniref:F-box domain-containing protein n=1 Tax=Ephemerocybe angulata TaxID=980116 RepID=A0A8H5AV95_9AGAR|nr:hypothetical protein D9611_009429 [Tulosesus angulatus]
MTPPILGSLSTFPTEILILILFPLDPRDLVLLSRTCRRMHDLVYEIGWPQYLASNPRPSQSLTSARRSWSPVKAVRYDTLTDRAWQRAEFVARPLSRTWAAKEQSTLAISPSRLIVAAGTVLYSYSFHASAAGQPIISWEGNISLNETHVRGRNITSIAFIEDGGQDQTLLVAFQEQLVERIILIPPAQGSDAPLSFSRTPLAAFPRGDYIESFSTNGSHVLSLSSNGTARLSLHNALDNCDPLSQIDLAERSWKSHLSVSSSTPYAAFGSTGKKPLTVHFISPDDGLSPTPSLVLHTEKSTPDSLSSSAVYGLSQAPFSSPWGASPQILASGWFDGKVRIYDIRCPSSHHSVLTGEDTSAPLLRPVLCLNDRWSTEPIYSVACGGGSGAHVAAGTARHSVVSFWDVRNPRGGWSVHAPGNDRSPVFSVLLEGSRLFGATEMRPFVYDFGPDATVDMFPSIAAGPRANREGLKHKPGVLSYRVSKYRHAGSGLGDEFN